MTSGYPDWLRAFLLLGKYGATYLPVLLDASGNLYAVFKGDKGDGNLVNVKVDADGQLVMIPRGANGNYLVVDASGYLTTVIKGDYAGALRTVKLDDQGRLSAFVIDSTDAWSQMLQIGNAELAARMGSLVRFDRRGAVLFTSNFENGMGGWGCIGTGTGWAHALDPTDTLIGGYSLRLTAPTEAANYIGAEQHTPYFLADSFGISTLYHIVAPYAYFDLALTVYDGVHAHLIIARLNYASGKIQVYTSAFVWVDIADYNVSAIGAHGYRYLKVVANIAAGKYVRLLTDNGEYDISAQSLKVSDSTAYPCAVPLIRLYSPEGSNSVARIDDVIVTAVET